MPSIICRRLTHILNKHFGRKLIIKTRMSGLLLAVLIQAQNIYPKCSWIMSKLLLICVVEVTQFCLLGLQKKGCFCSGRFDVVYLVLAVLL